MTLHQHLTELLSTYSPTEADLEQALRRAERVGDILVNEPTFAAHRWDLGGSCAKGTAIHPVKDVDIFVYMDVNHWRTVRGDRYHPSTVIGRFKQRLSQTFALHIERGDIQIKAQDHSVRVVYRKEGSQHIDVVPALWKQNPQRVAEIPEKSSARWVQTSVWRQQSILNDLDSHTKALRAGIRLLKLWRAHHRARFLKSYALELLAMAAWHRGCTRSPGGVLVNVLEHVVDTSLREPTVVTHHLKNFEIPKRKAVVIMDAAVKSNNVAQGLNVKDRQEVVRLARWTLESFQELTEAATGGQDRKARFAFQRVMGK